VAFSAADAISPGSATAANRPESGLGLTAPGVGADLGAGSATADGVGGAAGDRPAPPSGILIPGSMGSSKA
jgi:hypothetical protein